MNSEARELVEKRKDQGRELFNPAKFLALKKGKRYPKKHGAVMVYTDSVLEVRYDTYAPNLSVSVNGQRVLVFHLGSITRFIHGPWVEHLTTLAEPILEAEKQRKIEEAKKREAEYLAQWGITD
jgi:hypothetical protein